MIQTARCTGSDNLALRMKDPRCARVLQSSGITLECADDQGSPSCAVLPRGPVGCLLLGVTLSLAPRGGLCGALATTPSSQSGPEGPSSLLYCRPSPNTTPTSSKESQLCAGWWRNSSASNPVGFVCSWGFLATDHTGWPITLQFLP